jgi:hypothetical protein
MSWLKALVRVGVVSVFAMNVVLFHRIPVPAG